MLYLNADNIKAAGLDWEQLIAVIRNAVTVLGTNDYAQPIKPYLRYGDPKNRIIAMPAYVGGESAYAGIKWIASFPDNIHQNKLRAHSVTILNEHNTGVPLCVINTASISAIRTAAVSGLLIQAYLEKRTDDKPLKVGINGFGPIGRTHLKMVQSVLGSRLENITLFDLKPIDLQQAEIENTANITIGESWEAAYQDADIFITCTVSSAPYINLPPVKGSLQLNVSLRDYKVEMKDYMDAIIVDDWEEVCRQNTDIENMHKEKGLQKEQTLSIADIVCQDALRQYSDTDTIMFNPMGMAIFDIAVGGYYYQKAQQDSIGFVLPD
ncbi:2,3-diaminopropionate biosynthesis protein SbnB [Chitinophaga nivalis]|uniref:2,3-diaminopropionate biosynthesis protein SbnB n=1 Tax=Chitinophaga nivalis TaxID=2991709 RepID=A0ABT3IGU3_9BACT|nr:2,3-diaminopropionate biosynthesis protein SbnB [Chitinophaga nivalis]MCW3467116.1 2,3-diaminopropionate biosynthesis protein SbnB [Chitinophaga nivalis]MCW3483193.1 2,3-diaminopropionate biosynthesis protein SbnB [Chitinophaga nivalis]